MFRKLLVATVAAWGVASATFGQDLKKMEFVIGSWRGPISAGGLPIGEMEAKWEWLLDRQMVQGHICLSIAGQKVSMVNMFAIEDGIIRQWKFEPGKKCEVATLSFEEEVGILETPRDQFGVTRVEHQLSGDTLVMRGFTKEAGFPVYQVKLLKVKEKDVAARRDQQETHETIPTHWFSVLSTAPEGTTIHEDIPYVTNGHERQKLDLYLPPRVSGNIPLLVSIHGGAFRSLTKEQWFPKEPLRDGYAMASIGYRLSQHAVFPAQVEDCKAAIRWLRKHAEEYHIDPNRIAVMGTSAGGYLAGMVGATSDTDEFDVGENLEISSSVRAVVDFCGPSNFLVIDENRHPESKNRLDDPESGVSQLFGGLVSRHRDQCERANLLKYITANDPPFLVVHGDQDEDVPYHQSAILVESLRKANVPVTFHAIKGGGHTFIPDSAIARLVHEFVERQMKE